ncbi:hypothetical protein MN608_10744 [Microdochium nivale]|nr:hypothetical protein MN608_10744 [Microdochium nivale]
MPLQAKPLSSVYPSCLRLCRSRLLLERPPRLSARPAQKLGTRTQALTTTRAAASSSSSSSSLPSSERRATHAAMHSPAIASWHVPLSAADFARLKAGLQARGMDDRWEFSAYPDDDDSDGDDGTRHPGERLAVHIVRSWLNQEIYRLHIVGPDPGGHAPTLNHGTSAAAAAVGGGGDDGCSSGSSSSNATGARIRAITWDRRLDEPQHEIFAREAKIVTAMLVRNALGCTLEAAPHVNCPDGWD